ncbi:MAG: ABC transporter ATP-binding protein [Alphaproteobacteria bacterium]|nr:ABC transporter ATP-binding protein [Alphaproteobacteria bacterium]
MTLSEHVRTGAATEPPAVPTPSADRPVRLAFRGVSRAFGRLPAVADLSFCLRAGEILCLLGPSGCGKSTTLRLAAGIEAADAGEILVEGAIVDGGGRFVPPESRSVGLMFQDYALFPHLSVLGNVAFGLRGLETAERAVRARAALARVGMERFAEAWPHTLSGGEQQRVALARALAPKPRVLLMDEPFSGLDTGLRAHVREQALAVLREEGISGLMVTHDPLEAMAVGDRLALMRAGRLLQIGTPQAVFDRPADLWAARFLGEVSVVPGRVRAGEADTALGRFPASGYPDGAEVVLALRPHGVRLVPPEEGRPLARVRSCRSLGPELALRVEIEEAGLPAIELRVPARDAPAPGTRVGLDVDTARALVYPAEAAG